jgi:hypothetical protein
MSTFTTGLRTTIIRRTVRLGTAAAAEPGRALQVGERVPMREAVARLGAADERREGYERAMYKHWVDADRDGCNTRAEVLIAEAVQEPETSGRCRLTDGTGRWHSYYDDAEVTGARGLDIDHMVPLAKAYAKDLDEDRALVAVTARSNRSKADQDPREWLPEAARCRYIGEWTAIKLRWKLTADAAEKDTLTELAQDCPNAPINFTSAAR